MNEAFTFFKNKSCFINQICYNVRIVKVGVKLKRLIAE
jgi:hypothetical protein